MTAAGKLAAFAGVVAVVFGAAMVGGAAVGPIDVGPGGDHPATSGTEITSAPRGLATAAGGYRLALDPTVLEAGTPGVLEAGAPAEVGFRIVDDAGAPLTRFAENHERRLHAIVVSRNLVDYLHLHPVMDEHGRWTLALPALDPGSYRLFTDFRPAGGDVLTLGADLAVAGDVAALAVPAPSAVAAVDGYRVELAGTPAVGASELTFHVEVGGQPVATDPYLGAAGHLVAVRSSDLAYLHVHPHDDAAGPEIPFTTEFPSAGTYRLFFEFAHGGTVRTASYTVGVPPDTTSAPNGAAPGGGEEHG